MANPSPGNKDEAAARRLIQSIDDLLATGDWDATLFLKANKKKLEGFRKEAQALLDQLITSEQSEEPRMRQPPEGYKALYVSMFQSDPNNLLKWQAAIKGLEKYSVTRPVYGEEAHVSALIKHKPDSAREAYVIVFVKETDILKPYTGKKTEDRFGHELLTLREKAIQVSNVVEFVHEQKRYYYSVDRGLIFIEGI